MNINFRVLRSKLTSVLASAGHHTKPAFFIIGAQKSGTSAMFSILGQHPQIVAPRLKEPGLFYDNEITAGIKYGDFSTYHSIFPLPHRLPAGKMTFEATPEYLIYPECPKGIYDYAPEIKLIAILRDPITRAYSSWNMFRKLSNLPNPIYGALTESRTFEEAITAEIQLIEQGRSTRPWNYVRTGMYAEHLERYFQYFSREAMLILDYADFLQTPETCLMTVCQFLDIESTFQFNIVHKNVLSYESEISQNAIKILRSFYKPLNEDLFRLLGRDFKWQTEDPQIL